jgi:hypothetical protein
MVEEARNCCDAVSVLSAVTKPPGYPKKDDGPTEPDTDSVFHGLKICAAQALGVIRIAHSPASRPATAIVEVADPHRAVGAAHPAQDAGAFGARQVLVAPLLQRSQDHRSSRPAGVSRQANRESDPAAIAAIALDGLAAGAAGILADDPSRQVQAALSSGVGALDPAVA